MKQAVTNHIEKIRHSDDHIKRWWVIGATTIVMCIIVALWVIYISATLPKTSAQKGSDTAQTEKNETKLSLFGTIIEGVKITSNDVGSSLISFGSKFSNGIQSAISYTAKKKERIFEKTPHEIPFTPNNSEPLESIPLSQ